MYSPKLALPNNKKTCSLSDTKNDINMIIESERWLEFEMLKKK